MIRTALPVVPPVVGAVAASLILNGATISGAPLSALIISFFVYGFIGWAYESTVCAMLAHGRFANSGFLLGPCCPIYGVGGIACWLALRGVESVPSQFALAAVVCCAIEYVVGWALEQITNARFWDYSRFPLNLHGRICLYGALVFGTAALLVCRVAQPALLDAMLRVPAPALMAVAMVLVALTAVDAVFALASWRRLSAQLEDLRAEMAERINEGLRDVSDGLLEHVPEQAVDSVQTAHTRGRAINAWLATLSDAAMDALREKLEIPAFVVEGSEGLRMTAKRLVSSVPRPRMPERPRRPARPVPKLRLRRRDLRYFNAFPNLRMLPYEGVIRATNLADRARELSRRR